MELIQLLQWRRLAKPSTVLSPYETHNRNIELYGWNLNRNQYIEYPGVIIGKILLNYDAQITHSVILNNKQKRNYILKLLTRL